MAGGEVAGVPGVRAGGQFGVGALLLGERGITGDGVEIGVLVLPDDGGATRDFQATGRKLGSVTGGIATSKWVCLA